MTEGQAIKIRSIFSNRISQEELYTKLTDELATEMDNAITKQIPVKPNIHGYREGREVNTISYTCPICNKHIGRDKFCKHCSQALDWGDRE